MGMKDQKKWAYANTVGGLKYELQFCEDKQPIAWDIWCVEDILHQAKRMKINLTEAETVEVLEAMHHDRDKSVGFNWKVAAYWLEENI